MFESLFKKILHFIFPHVNISYSQSAEDILLTQHIFNGKNTGFYVDIGAHHPQRFSNTYLLYQKGWSGINIDPIPGMQELFNGRVRDVNINTGISTENGAKKYFVFKKGALNTFDEQTAKKQSEKYGEPTVLEVEVMKLDEILDKFAKDKKIDFLNIDVEGHELEVLNSNDWQSYSPTVIAIEDQGMNIENPDKSSTYNFLKLKGYKLTDKLNYTCFYKRI